MYLDKHFTINPDQPILFCADVMSFIDYTNINVFSLLQIHAYAQRKQVPYGTLLLVPRGGFEDALTRSMINLELEFCKSRSFYTVPEYAPNRNFSAFIYFIEFNFAI